MLAIARNIKRNNNKNSDITIKNWGTGRYYGFILDGNNRFMLKDGTITHNTTLAQILGELYSNLDILSGNNIFKKVTILKKDDNTLHKSKRIACRFLLK